MALSQRSIVKSFLGYFDKQKKQKKSEEIYERCVVCGELTAVRIDTPIELRDNYEIGFGQVCHRCHKQFTE